MELFRNVPVCWWVGGQERARQRGPQSPAAVTRALWAGAGTAAALPPLATALLACNDVLVKMEGTFLSSLEGDISKEFRHSGIDFLSLCKAGLCLDVETERGLDATQPINQGVTSDRVVTDRRGFRVREITFCNPCDGAGYVYLTNELTLAPALLGLLYKTRWEIEKVFDETKTKLAEKKSWATTTTAKARQAHFAAIVHNLLLLLQDWHEQQGVVNTAEKERRQKRQEQQQAGLQQTGRTLPLIHTLLRRFTQATFKLIRWLARPLASPDPAVSSPAPATLPLRQTLTT